MTEIHQLSVDCACYRNATDSTRIVLKSNYKRRPMFGCVSDQLVVKPGFHERRKHERKNKRKHKSPYFTVKTDSTQA